MTKVYIVSKRLFRKYANCEPYISETTLKVFGSFDKVVKYICDLMKRDRDCIDDKNYDPRGWTKYYMDRETFKNGYYIKSIEFEDEYAYESTCYRFVSYDVE